MSRDPNYCRSIAGAPCHIYRSLVARHKPPVRVGRRRHDRCKCSSMFYYASAKIACGLRYFCVFVSRVIEQVLALVPEANINMHARPVVKRNRLWHHRRNHVLFLGNVLDNILVTLNGIGSINQGIKSDVDLALTGSRYFVMMSITHYAEIIRKYIDAFVTIFHEGVARRAWKVTLLEP